MTYINILDRLIKHGVIDNEVYNTMSYSISESEQLYSLILICNAMVDKQIALSKLTGDFVSKR